MTPADIKKQQALSPGPWYLQIGDGSMPYYIMTPLDKTIVAATVYKCDADYIIEMSAKITDLEGKVKILESLLESEQTILKLRTAERDKLTKEVEAAHTLWTDAVRQLEEKDKELEAEKDLVAVQNKEIEQLQQLLKTAEEQNKNLTDNYRNRLLDIQEFKEMVNSNRETIDRLIEENKGMKNTLALYAKNED